jgi:uncharacterized protein
MAEQENDALLWEATEEGDLGLMTEALDGGANIESLNEYGWTPLMQAVINGDTAGLSLLLQRGAKVNVASQSGSTPLLYAVNGDSDMMDIVKILLKAGADIDAKDSLGSTALEVACREYESPAALLLLEAGAKQGLDCALQEAVMSRCENLVRALLEQGAKFTMPESQTILSRVAEKGYTDMVRLLLDLELDPSVPDEDSRTPLLVSLASFSSSAAMMLIERGADPNQASADGTLPLELAARHGREDIVQALLAGGADPLKKGKDGIPLLTCSLEGGNILIAELLLRSGCRSDERDSAGKTPLDQAFDRNNWQFFQLLLDESELLEPKEAMKKWEKARKEQRREITCILGEILRPLPEKSRRTLHLNVTGARSLLESFSIRWESLLKGTSNSPESPFLIFLGETLSLLDGGAPCVFEAGTFEEGHAFGRTVSYSLHTPRLSLKRSLDQCINESWQSMTTDADETIFTHPQGTPDLIWNGDINTGPWGMSLTLKDLQLQEETRVLALARSLFLVTACYREESPEKKS